MRCYLIVVYEAVPGRYPAARAAAPGGGWEVSTAPYHAADNPGSTVSPETAGVLVTRLVSLPGVKRVEVLKLRE